MHPAAACAQHVHDIICNIEGRHLALAATVIALGLNGSTSARSLSVIHLYEPPERLTLVLVVMARTRRAMTRTGLAARHSVGQPVFVSVARSGCIEVGCRILANYTLQIDAENTIIGHSMQPKRIVN